MILNSKKNFKIPPKKTDKTTVSQDNNVKKTPPLAESPKSADLAPRPGGGRRFNYHEPADPHWQQKVALGIKTAAVASITPATNTAAPPAPKLPDAIVKSMINSSVIEPKINKHLSLIPQQEEQMGDIPLKTLVWISIFIGSAALFLSIFNLQR